MSQKVSEKTEYGLEKEDLIRLSIQLLQSLDLPHTAEILEKESKVRLYSDTISTFRESIFRGNWDAALESLWVLEISSEEKLRLVKFLILRQKYVEQIGKKQFKEALKTLRREISPLMKDSNQLHKLATLIVCQSTEELEKRGKWTSREQLLSDIQQYMRPGLMLPDDKLQKILSGKLLAFSSSSSSSSSSSGDLLNINHDVINLGSIYEDPVSLSKLVPRDIYYVFLNHKEEVWAIDSSPDGMYLASGSVDKNVIIYKLSEHPNYHPIICSGHLDSVSSVKWSPDSSMLLSSSNDKTVILWRHTGVRMQIFSKHRDKVSSIAWIDNKTFFSSGHGADKTLYKWNIDDTSDPEEEWNLEYRIQDMQVTSDGKKVVLIGNNKNIYIYPTNEQSLKYTISDPEHLTSLSLSPDGRYMLVNCQSDQMARVKCYDLVEYSLLKDYHGHLQTKFVLRSCFGGSNGLFGRISNINNVTDLSNNNNNNNKKNGDVKKTVEMTEGEEYHHYSNGVKKNHDKMGDDLKQPSSSGFSQHDSSSSSNLIMVFCGSEDGTVKVWDTQTGRLVETLKGHNDTVNVCIWIQKQQLLATCSDDGTVKLWKNIIREKEL